MSRSGHSREPARGDLGGDRGTKSVGEPAAETASAERSASTAGPAPRARLAGAALIMMSAFVASRATGLLREIAVSYQFGVGREMDAYVAAIKIPDTVFQITAGGAVASAFIPVFTAYLARDERDEAWRMVSTLFNLALVVLLPIIALLMIVAPDLMRLMTPNYEPRYQILAGDLARILLIAPLFFTLGCFVTSVLNSHQRFFLAALAPTVYNLGIIAGALVFGPSLGIHGLAIGATTGSLLFLLVQAPGLRQVGMRYAGVLDLRLSGVREVGRLMLPRTIGLAASQVGFIAAVYLAPAVPGAVTALDRAWLLTMLPLGIFAMAISSAVFPSLATQSAQDQLVEMRQTVASALRFILFLTVPATVGLLLLAEPLVRILFERGAFTAEATAMIAHALRFYVPGLIAMSAVEIVTRAFYALHDTRTPVAVSVGTMLLNLALALALIPAFSYGGLALAMTLSSTLGALVLIAIAERRLPGLLDREIAGSVLRSALGALFMGIALAFALPAVSAATPPTLLGRVLALGLLVAGGGAVYLAAAFTSRAPEIAQLEAALPISRLRARLGRRP